MDSGSGSGTPAGGHQDIPDYYLERWQPLVETLALYFDVPAAMIARVNPENIEYIVSSVKEERPYHAGFTHPADFQTYCESVIRSRNEVLVENASDDPQWKDLASAQYGMVSYYGLPVLFPDGEIFGAVCVMDKKSRSFDNVQKKILEEIKKLIELDLSGLCESVKSLFFDLVDKFSYLKKLIDLGPVDILLFDRHGHIISDSVAEPIIRDIKRIFSGRDDSLHELIVEGYGNLIKKKIKEVLGAVEAVKFELKLTINEKDRYFICSMDQFFGSYIVALIFDITGLKKKEMALSWSEKLKDLILDRMPVFVWSTDTNLNIQALYGQILSAKGYSADMILERPMAEVLDDLPDREKILNVHKGALNGVPAHYEADLFGYSVSAYLEPLYEGEKITGTIGVAYDITPQKLAENYYHDIYDKYRLVMDAANEGFWEWDEKRGYVNTNPSFFRMLGYEPDEFHLSLEKLKKMIHHDESAEVFRNLWEIRAKPGSHYEREIRLRCKGGGWKWFMFRARSIAEDRNGGLTRVIGTYTDINARKEAEERLRDSEKKYREIVETANESVVVFDSDLRINFANRLFSESTGFKEEELINKSLYDFIPEEDMPHIRSVLEERMNGKGGYAECRFKRKDGSLFWVFSTTRPRLDEEGRFSGMLTMFIDITDKKKAEESLEQNIKILNEIFETSNEAILSLDSEYRISYVNEKVLDFSGYSREEILNKPVSIFFYNEDLPSLNKLLEERRKGGLNYSELRVKIKDGSQKLMMVASKSRLDEEGHFAGMLAMVMDITGRKEAEENLQKSEEKYRTLAEAALDSIYIIGRDDTVLYINTRASRLLHAQVEKVIGKPRKMFFPHDIADQQGRSLQKVFDTGEPLRIEGKIVFGDREFWLDNSLVPLKDENGNVTSVLGVSRDITDRKKAEDG